MIPDGITVHKFDRYALCCIDNFSDELKDLIRSELNIICYGKARIDADGELYYSYENTLKEFLVRYDKKTSKIQTGMLGELLAHMLIGKVFPELEIISMLLNKEERHIRKGFDLNYLGAEKDRIWYGEVKSGAKQDKTVEGKNRLLLENAKTDLHEKLTSKRRSLWDGALNDVAICIAAQNVNSVSKILKEDFVSLQADYGASKNAILVSVLFHDINEKISVPSINSYLSEVNEDALFAEAIVTSIQKSTLTKLEGFLREEARR